MKLLDQVRRFHRNGDAGAVIDRPRAEIPRIQMSRNDNDLFGMFGAFDVADNVEARRVGERLRGENEMHAHYALRRKRRDQIRVFRGDSAGRNLWGVRLVIVLASMGQPKFRAADGTNEGGDGSEPPSCGGAIGPIFY